MNSNALPVLQMRHILEMEVEKAGGQSAWAKKHGLHRTNINEMIAGKRDISVAVINALGFILKPTCIPIKPSARELCNALNSN